MGFSTALKAELAKSHGEMLKPRLTVRLHEGSEVELSAVEHCITLSPIRREREFSFGVVQAASWQASFSNATLFHVGRQLAGCWVALDVGFPTANIWDRVATGKIRKATASTDSTLVIEVQEPLRDLVDATLPRDIYFGQVGWLSEIQPEQTANDSRRYDGSPTASSQSQLRDETFTIEFLAATTFQVTDGDDNTYGPFSISSDASHGTAAFPLSTLVTIPSSGWSTDSGAYADGDTFIFYTARPRTTAELSTIGMVRHLIEDVAEIEAFNFSAGSFGTAISDPVEWSRVEALVSDDYVEGHWRRGSRVIEMCQQLLKLSHASIYPTMLGQVGVWILEPSGGAEITLNADPGQGDISLLSGTYLYDLSECYSAVEYEYLALDGEEASVRAEADDSETDAPGSTLTIRTSWRVRGATVAAAASKGVNRFRRQREIYSGKGTLAAARIDLSEGLVIQEPELGLDAHRSDSTLVELDVNNNSASVEAWTDPVSIADAFVLGQSLLDTGEIW
jgi:hypothetical protein